MVSDAPVAPRPRMKYERGAVAPWQPQLVERVADVAVAAMPIPLRVLDVGAGDGRLLNELIVRVPQAELFVGVDPVPDLVPRAQRAAEPRLSLVRAAAEALPFADASFDLVIAAMSFAYWTDQRVGVAELARVVSDNGVVVLAESTHPEGAGRGRGRARSEKDIAQLLRSAGLHVDRVETLHRSLLRRPLVTAFICSL